MKAMPRTATPRVGWAASRSRLAVQADAPADRIAQAQQRLDELALSAALDAGDSHDLAGMDAERRLPEAQRAEVVADAEPIDVDDGITALRAASQGGALELL